MFMKCVFGELYDLRLTILRIKMVWMYEQKKKSLIENVISRQSGIQTVRVIEIIPGILFTSFSVLSVITLRIDLVLYSPINSNDVLSGHMRGFHY